MNTIPIKDRISNYSFILLLSGLIFLLVPFVILMAYHKIPIPIDKARSLLYNGTYLITAALIILKRNSLSDYNIDTFSIFILIIAPAAEILSAHLLIKEEITIQPNTFKIVISILFLSTLLLFQPKLHKQSIKKTLSWILIAVIAGICAGALIGIAMSMQGGKKELNSPSLYYFWGSFHIQLSVAAVTEEPFFRGFLWGLLKKASWKDTWICLFQAVLFTVCHISYLGKNNYYFFIIVPTLSLILGLLVWRSKSIGTSIIAHALINTTIDIATHFTW